MLMPHRSYASTANYRFGFNGKENDNEPKGLGNQQDYGMRIYDPRLGRFLSFDPISNEYPSLTPYQFAGNTPIWATDLDGLEPNFSNLKLKRVEYTDYGMGALFNGLANSKEFGANSGVSAVNGLVDMAEVGIGIFSTKGREKINKETLTPAVNAFFQWGMMSTDQQVSLLKQVAKDPETWESLAGNIALGGLLKGLPKINIKNALSIRLYPFIRLAESFKLADATTKVNFWRDVLIIKDSRNIAILEGQIGNIKVMDIAVSGKETLGTTGLPKNRFFKTFEVKGFSRAFDSEVKILENFAQTYKDNTNVTGTLRLISERKICASCDEVIDQFKKMFPNIKVEVVHGVK